MAKNQANGTKAVRGYKAFNSDWTCKEFQYEVGKTYKIEGKIEICESGFHFCTKLIDCFAYYPFGNETKVAEVEATGRIIDSCADSKKCTNEITIVREIPFDEVLRLCNIGEGNIGYSNTGDWNIGRGNTGIRNAGNRNTGAGNTGHWNVGSWNNGIGNTGDWNVGRSNTGNWNTGGHNTGDWNTGNYNTGNSNTGYCNIGDWNTSSYSSGCFCTEEKKIELFDKPSDMTLEDWRMSNAYRLLSTMPHEKELKYVLTDDMTDSEIEGHLECRTTGGYLHVTEDKSAPQKWFNSLSDDKKKIIMSIPNFDAEKFLLCTGIDVRK